MEKWVQKNKILVIALWALALTVSAQSVRHVIWGSQPPLWDSLVYQIFSMNLFRSLIEHRENLIELIYNDSYPIGYMSSLVSGLFFFGPTPDSMYKVNGIYVGVWIYAITLLTRQLGGSLSVGLMGALLYSVLPNFLYRNFFETQTDYPMAAVLALSWLFFLKALKKEPYAALFSGILGGIASLLKLAAPGYEFVGPFLFLFAPFLFRSQLNIKERLRIACIYSISHLTISGFYIIPVMPEVIKYNYGWSLMGTWQASQYHLVNKKDWLLFYFRTLKNVHVPGLAFVAICFLFFSSVTATVFNYLKSNSRKKIPRWTQLTSNGYFLTVTSVLVLYVFFTYKKSLTVGADIPLLTLLLPCFLVFVEINLPVLFLTSRNVLICLPIAVGSLIHNFGNLPIAEPRYNSTQLDNFSTRMRRDISRYMLQGVPIFADFSHPYLNFDVLNWKWAFDYQIPLDTLPTKFGKIFVLNLLMHENPQSIADNLDELPALLRTQSDPLNFGGEPFHTLNRYHQAVEKILSKKNSFQKVDEFMVDRIDMQLYVKKDFARIRFDSSSTDGWMLWGDTISVFSIKAGKIQLEGKRLGPFDAVILVSEEKKIRLKLTETLRDGTSKFVSDTISFPGQLMQMKVEHESSYTPVAAQNDPRPLGLYEPKISLVH